MINKDQAGHGRIHDFDAALDAPGAEADPAQRLEAGLEQRVAAFGRGADRGVQQVDGALIVGQPATGGGLDRGGRRWS
jgi:hypothetical protein